jgi:hypothetical protein
MTPRRSRYSPTDESRIPHWLVTYDAWRNVLVHERLAIGTGSSSWNAKGYRQVQDGQMGCREGAYEFFFCNRNGERREVRIQPNDPAEPIPLNNTSARGNPSAKVRAADSRCSSAPPEVLYKHHSRGGHGSQE